MRILLIVIYAAFISLGLPDALLGSAWPAMYENLGVALSAAGAVSMIITVGTIISSLLSERLILKLGAGMVTLVSVAMTAAALMGIAFSNSFILLCLWAVPLGLGAGSVDAALNNFVALHYEARHMNWLHCFWGIGASAGPIIMAQFLARANDWQGGYRTIGFIQIALVAILFLSLPLFRRAEAADAGADDQAAHALPFREILALPGAKPTLVAFFSYCAIELTTGLWGTSFLVAARGVATGTAARYISLFYVGITVGRLLSGFLAARLSYRQMMRLGLILIGAGIIILTLPTGGAFLLIGLFAIGLGCAPLYPSMLHETPNLFGKRRAQALMGVQMACAYMGSAVAPPLFGLIGARAGYGLLPLYLAVPLLLMIAMVILQNRARANITPDD